jgi:hypothetical protein
MGALRKIQSQNQAIINKPQKKIIKKQIMNKKKSKS